MPSLALVCPLWQFVLLLVSQWNCFQSGNTKYFEFLTLVSQILLSGLSSVRLVLQRRLSESRGTLREQQRAVQGQRWQPNLILNLIRNLILALKTL